MMTLRLERGALITRDAYSELLELKHLVERGAEHMHEAERQAVGLAIGNTLRADPVKALIVAAEALQSPAFEAAVSEARAKTGIAIVWQMVKHS